MNTRWEEAMWAELNEQPGPQQLVAATEYIAIMSRNLLRELGNFRRQKAIELIDSGKYTYGSLADEIGTHAGTVRRLVEEGRAYQRDQDHAQAA